MNTEAADGATNSLSSVWPSILPEEKVVRIGTYDSRSIAIAYLGSRAYKQTMDEYWRVYETAKKEGDQQRIAELDALATERQKRMFNQGFSIAWVDESFTSIGDKLPEVAKNAGVTCIVPIWHDKIQARVCPLESIDITMALVNELTSDPWLRTCALNVQGLWPLPRLTTSDPVPRIMQSTGLNDLKGSELFQMMKMGFSLWNICDVRSW
ncbi:MAG TPA: hypothetical protein PLI09_01905 [Candidatus Hydrogenedentes bacterium]|nr:hypothetical protein [Candidatus Hydrogenedentota bacterium]